jgi:hypothetical protein
MKKLLFLPLVLIVSFCFAQYAKEIIGKPVKIGNLLVAQFDFPKQMNWYDAKKACEALGIGWRLPTKSELNILYKNRTKIGGFVKSKNKNEGYDSNKAYWSSTTIDPIPKDAWIQIFEDGFQNITMKDFPFYVRAVYEVEIAHPRPMYSGPIPF